MGEGTIGRRNVKRKTVDYSNTIKKSNEFSMAKLNQGLTLNQMQLLAFAIFSTQRNGETMFRKHEFQEKFEIGQYRTEHAYEDSQEISALQFSTQDFKNNKFSFTNVFNSIKYENGLFDFRWNKDMLPHILELKNKYVITDLTITSKFKSGFSWVLYDYLKAHYGYWNKKVTKDEMMKLFSVENKKSYQANTSRFKQSVLNVAVRELNKYTELEVWYTDEKVGNKITGFTLHWYTGKRVARVTDTHASILRTIHNEVENKIIDYLEVKVWYTVEMVGYYSTGFTLHWSTGKRVARVTDKQASLIRTIHDEVEKKMFDYLSLENMEDLKLARNNILKIKEINNQVNDQLTSEEAKGLIWDLKVAYQKLEDLLIKDGREDAGILKFNWLEDLDN